MTKELLTIHLFAFKSTQMCAQCKKFTKLYPKLLFSFFFFFFNNVTTVKSCVAAGTDFELICMVVFHFFFLEFLFELSLKKEFKIAP